MNARTLSPSDVGFHNTLQRPDGSLMFLDFEHFGWDDPAKLACDFLLHPAMDLPQSILRHYLRNIVDALPKAASLDWRIPILYPVFALKWCAILLNEFVSEHENRRNYAMRRTGRREIILAEQLNKARGMLRLARKAHERPLQVD